MQLSEILITDLLQTRAATQAGRGQGEGEAITPYPLMGGNLPVEEVLAERCRQAMTLCGAQSAGISMFSPSGFDTLTWLGAVGEISPFDQHVFPRDDSACGVCFSYRSPQLFRHPELYFSWLKNAGIVFEELLVSPIQGPYGAFFGTMWVGSHGDGARKFTAGDLQVLERFSAGLWSRLADLGSATGTVAP